MTFTTKQKEITHIINWALQAIEDSKNVNSDQTYLD